MMNKKSCEHWWKHAELLPFKTLIEYWCNANDSCKQVKEMALISALNNGAVKYQRTDGKTWEDQPLQLIGNGALAVERDSFEEWLAGIEEPDPLPLSERKEITYQAIIGAMLKLLKTDPKKRNQSTVESEIAAWNIAGLGQENLHGYFKNANKTFKEKEEASKM